MRRLRAIRRSLGFWTAVTYVIGSLALSMHYLGDQHSVCIEHQTVHHIEGDDAEHAASLDPYASINAISLSEDDHCELIQLVRPFQLAPISAHFAFRGEAAAAVLRDALPDLPDLPTSDRWRVAPKQSPPAAI